MIPIGMTGLQYATYGTLLVSILLLWAPFKNAWLFVVAVSVGLGYLSGVLSGPAILPVLILGALCWRYGKNGGAENGPRTFVQGFLALGIAAMVLLLGLHIFPGFNNVLVADKTTLSPTSTPYSLRLNFDKTVAGLLLLGLLHPIFLKGWKEWKQTICRALPIITLNIVIVVALSFVLGYVKFEPKWTSFFVLWAIVNLFFTCMSEEAFFRGYIQQQIDLRLRENRYGKHIAIATSAILFGLVHFAGGIMYVVLATIAGAGYALAYQRTGRIEMSILAHFSLNTVHFLLLTYPRAI